MTAGHLFEYEGWPGTGGRVTGRKPTPYVLALLARTYGAGIPDLLDTRDYRNLSPADRLIIEACSPAACPHSRATGTSPRPAPRCQPRRRARRRGSTGHDGGYPRMVITGRLTSRKQD
jgi:hypothetical protein